MSSGINNPQLSPIQRANFIRLNLDSLWFGGLVGSSMAFLVVYLVHLGASTTIVGLLTAGPAFINLFISLPAGRWLENRPVQLETFRSSVWHRFGYLLFIPLPWLFDAPSQIWVMLIITLAMSIPGTVLAISFNAMFADVVPPEWRARLVGQRTALMAMAVILTSFGAGQILNRVPFPVNYQYVFFIGLFCAALSSYYLGRVELPGSENQVLRTGRPIRDPVRPGLFRFGDDLRSAFGLRYLTRAAGASLFRIDLLKTSFGPFMGAFLLFYIFQYIPIPLFPLFWIRILHISDVQLSTANATFYLSLMISSLWVQRVTDKVGHHRTLIIGAVLYGMYPLINGLANDIRMIYLASLIGGAVWALTNTGLLTRLMERVPEVDRPAYMALHNMILNIGILIGAFLGPFLGDIFGLREIIILSAGLRMLGGILIGIWG